MSKGLDDLPHYFNWLSNHSDLVLSNGSKKLQNSIQMTLKWQFFFRKITKIAQRYRNVFKCRKVIVSEDSIVDILKRMKRPAIELRTKNNDALKHFLSNFSFLRPVISEIFSFKVRKIYPVMLPVRTFTRLQGFNNGSLDQYCKGHTLESKSPKHENLNSYWQHGKEDHFNLK